METITFFRAEGLGCRGQGAGLECRTDPSCVRKPGTSPSQLQIPYTQIPKSKHP